jgi:hypothetical protein
MQPLNHPPPPRERGGERGWGEKPQTGMYKNGHNLPIHMHLSNTDPNTLYHSTASCAKKEFIGPTK